MDRIDEALNDHFARRPDREASKLAAEIAREAETASGEDAPARAVRRAQKLMGGKVACPHCKASLGPLRAPASRQWLLSLGWLALSLAAFAASFYFKRYFMQCLAVTLLAGAKWIADTRALKAKVLVYRALSADSADPSEHLHDPASRL